MAIMINSKRRPVWLIVAWWLSCGLTIGLILLDGLRAFSVIFNWRYQVLAQMTDATSSVPLLMLISSWTTLAACATAFICMWGATRSRPMANGLVASIGVMALPAIIDLIWLIWEFGWSELGVPHLAGPIMVAWTGWLIFLLRKFTRTLSARELATSQG